MQTRFGVWCPNWKHADYFRRLGFVDAVYNGGFTPRGTEYEVMRKAFDDVGMSVAHFPRTILDKGVNLSSWKNPSMWTITDEPIMHGVSAGNWNSQKIFSKEQADLPVMGNLEGDKFSSEPGSASQSTITMMKAFLVVPEIVTMDFYGWSRVRYTPQKKFLSWYGIRPMLNSFWLMSQHKRPDQTIGLVFEMGNQGLEPESRAPTRQELRQVIFGAYSLGARYFMGFPQRVPKIGVRPIYRTYGDLDNCTDPNVESELRDIIKVIQIADTLGPITSSVIQNPYGDAVITFDRGQLLITDFFDKCVVDLLVTDGLTTRLASQSSPELWIEPLPDPIATLGKRLDFVESRMKSLSDGLISISKSLT